VPSLASSAAIPRSQSRPNMAHGGLASPPGGSPSPLAAAPAAAEAYSSALVAPMPAAVAATVLAANRARTAAMEQQTCSVESVRDLAAAGAYRAAARLCEQLVMTGRSGERTLPPHEVVRVRLAQVRCLVRLREYRDALDVVEHMGLDAPAFRYETYPHIYADGRRGSTVPFALRLLAAELPAYAGALPLAVERLAALAAKCAARRRGPAAAADGDDGLETDSGGTEARVAAWTRRHQACRMRLAAVLLRARRSSLTVLQVLDALAEEYPRDPAVGVFVTLALLQLGLVDRAAAAAAALAADADPAPPRRHVELLAGLVALARGDSAAAARAFASARGFAARVDAAVAAAVEGDVAGAVEALERLLLADDEGSADLGDSVDSADGDASPPAAAEPPPPPFDFVVVHNLLSLYDLHGAAAKQDRYRLLHDVAGARAGEDLELDCMRR
jgi:hypothetical protein